MPVPMAKVAIYVFGLFHPREVEIAPVGASVLRVQCGDGVESTTRLEGNAHHILGSGCRAEAYAGGDAEFELSVPGKIRRRFRGTVEVHGRSGEVLPVVRMDLETAVAAIVAAELSLEVPQAAFEAQAIAVRSYLVAGGMRHRMAHSCDTTHCQFMRDPPAETHRASLAASRTRGQMLVYNGRVVGAMYSGSCAGKRTRRAAVHPGTYPFFDVPCPACRRNPTSQVPGHTHGLCQTGARHLAADGKTALEILAHYYPGASVRAMASGVSGSPVE